MGAAADADRRDVRRSSAEPRLPAGVDAGPAASRIQRDLHPQARAATAGAACRPRAAAVRGTGPVACRLAEGLSSELAVPGAGPPRDQDSTKVAPLSAMYGGADVRWRRGLARAGRAASPFPANPAAAGGLRPSRGGRWAGPLGARPDQSADEGRLAGGVADRGCRSRGAHPRPFHPQPCLPGLGRGLGGRAARRGDRDCGWSSSSTTKVLVETPVAWRTPWWPRSPTPRGWFWVAATSGFSWR